MFLILMVMNDEAGVFTSVPGNATEAEFLTTSISFHDADYSLVTHLPL